MHGAEDARGPRAESPGALEARGLLARSAPLAGGESQALARAEGVAGDGVIRRNGRQPDSKATAGYREHLTLSRQREEAITPAPELDPSPTSGRRGPAKRTESFGLLQENVPSKGPNFSVHFRKDVSVPEV